MQRILENNNKLFISTGDIACVESAMAICACIREKERESVFVAQLQAMKQRGLTVSSG